MRQHARAATARSSMRQAGRLGSIRRAFATRDASSDADGSSPPSHSSARAARARARFFLAALAVAVLALAIAASLAGASKSVIASFGSQSFSEGLGGQFSQLKDVAVNNASGDIYVVDRGKNRVQRFDSEGNFISAWGFDTIQSGKPGDLGNNVFEVCAVAADCKDGINSLIGGVNPGGEFSGSVGIAIDQSTGNLYVTNADFQRVEEFSASGGFIRAFGLDVIQPGKPGDLGENAVEVCAVAADCKGGKSGSIGGAFLLSFDSGLATVPPGAPNSGDVLVTDRGNRRVQEFTSAGVFVRAFGFDVVQSGPGDTVAGEFEICNAGGADVCKEGAPGGTGTGQFGQNGPNEIAEDSAGTIYTVEHRTNFRVQRFTLPGNVVTPQGAFAPGILDGTSESTSPTLIEIGASGNVLVSKGFSAGATPSCLNSNVPSKKEHRLLELSPAGALLDTHLTCAGIFFPSGLALNPASGRIYLSSTFPVNTAQVYVLDNVTPPTATIDPVTEVEAFSATLKGEVDPQGSLTECRFDYLTMAAFEANVAEAKDAFTGAAKVPCESSPGSGTGPIPVSAHATPLVSSTAYKTRLVAFRPPFGDIAAASPTTEEFSTTAEPPPTVISGAVAPRGTTSARLSGLVNPNNSATEVHFEYGTEGPCLASPCVSTTPQNVGSTYIPPGQPFTAVSFELEELQPATTYNYRLVGTNGVGTSAGDDRTFTTLPVEPVLPCPNEDVRQKQHTDGYLPDCRGVELVSSPDKGNSNVMTDAGAGVLEILPPISADGEKALWSTSAGVPGTFNGTTPPLLAERSAGGWHSRGLAPPPAQQVGEGDLTYYLENATPSFSNFLVNAKSAAGPAGFGGKTLLRLDTEQHQDVLKTYKQSVNATSSRSEMTDDGAHVLVVNPDTKQLEDIGKPGEEPETISLMPAPGSPIGVPQPGGTPSECGLDTNGASFAGGGAGHTGAEQTWRRGYRFIETEDASRVYFEAKADGKCAGLYGLYVRNRETDATTLIDPGASGEDPHLIRATPDGTSAYFATASKLDPTDKNEGATEGGDIYRWDEAAGESSCLTCVVPIAGVANDRAPVMVSDDFSHAYFESLKQLVPGRGKAGERNLYVLSGGAVRFVANPKLSKLSDPSPLVRGSAELSSDGKVLVFRVSSDTPLTADALPSQCLQPHGGLGQCNQLYRYDDGDGSLECLSCRHGAETESSFGSNSGLDGDDFHISSDGSTAAFVTRETLAANDVNGGFDVYQWRGGVRRLVTDGVTSFPQGFAAPQAVAVDADGSDIFFSVAAPGLTGFEQDGLASLYDARIGGGFLPPSPQVHCIEDSCQGPLQAPPALDKAASSGVSRGNPHPRKPRPCARKRGKAKRRCIRKHKRHAQARANRNAGRTK